jgi:hypothetical protein
VKRLPVLCLFLLALIFPACADMVGPELDKVPLVVQQMAVDGPCGKYLPNDRAYVGCADGVDGTFDGLYYGAPSQYASDHLVMVWNQGWNDGNAEGWSNPPYNAWITNQWSGSETWHYKIEWNGPCGPDGTGLPDGSYCIWGQFKVTMSHGNIGSQHFWDVHARRPGLGN